MAIPIINGANVARALNQLPLVDINTNVEVQDDGVPLTTKSNFANAINCYTFADAGFRAPYINFYKARGTESNPTPVTLTGYEFDSVGGINFGGYDGAGYFLGCSIYTQVDENWATGKHGAHISIYGCSVGSTTNNQLMQFGGIGARDQQLMNSNGKRGNNISLLPISFNDNLNVNPLIKPFNSAGSGPGIGIRNADDTADGYFMCGALHTSAECGTLFKLKTYTVATLPSASSNAGWEAQVTDSSVTTYRSTVAGGGANRVRVFSNGTNWVVN